MASSAGSPGHAGSSSVTAAGVSPRALASHAGCVSARDSPCLVLLRGAEGQAEKTGSFTSRYRTGGAWAEGSSPRGQIQTPVSFTGRTGGKNS